MKILFADKFPLSFLGQLEDAGHTCTLDPGLTAEDLPQALEGVDILVVRSTRVTADAVAAADALEMIIRAGAGTNTIDKTAAAERGIYVCNVPGKNASAVAELAIGLLIAIDRNIPDNVIQIRQGKWDKKRFSEATGLYGRSIGVVGLGAIGLAFMDLAFAFGMHIHVIAKPDRSEERIQWLHRVNAVEVEDILELARRCDIVSVHVPATEQTRGLVDEVLLAQMKPGAILLNTSRGDVVDEAALIRAMDEKGIRAGIDVYMNEPAAAQGDFECALAQHPNVYGTHHIGASTSQAQDAVAAGVVEVISAFVGGHVVHCVNMQV